MSKQKLKGLWIPVEILLNEDLSDKENKKNNKANFEQRDYTGFDLTKLYANADVFL